MAAQAQPHVRADGPGLSPGLAPELATVGLFQRGDLTLGFPSGRLAEVARVLSVLPALQCGPACLGGLDLRGLHVPLIDLPRLATGSGAAAPAASAPHLAAVLSVGGRMVAVGVDKVLGLARLPVAFPAGDDTAPSALRTDAVIHRGALVNLVDPDALVAHPLVRTVEDRRSATLALSRVQRRQMIQFDVGGATLAIPAVEIHATLPRRAITRNALTSGICLGSIVLPQGPVAVVSASALFGLGAVTTADSSEVIVVPLDSGAPIGLAVERILRIAEIDLAQAVDFPRRGGEGLLSASLVDPAGEALFVVDPTALRAEPRLCALAAVTSRAAPALADVGRAGSPPAGAPRDVTAAEAPPPEATAVQHRRERYLLIDAGVQLAVPITSVTRILPAPKSLISVDFADPGLVGLTVIEREVMPMVLPRGATITRDDIGRVLIVDTPTARAAIAVRQVLGVVTSSWRARGGSDQDAGAPTLIRVDAGSTDRAHHRVVDLAAQVDALAEALPAARRARPAA